VIKPHFRRQVTANDVDLQEARFAFSNADNADMTARHLVRHLIYSHLFGSYSAGFVAALMYARLNVFKIVEYAFPIFLAPLILPIVAMLSNQWQALAVLPVYGVVFVVVLISLRRRQSACQIAEQVRILEALAQPAPAVPLEYFSPPRQNAEPYRKIELTAAVSGLIALFAGGACFAYVESQDDSAQKIPGLWIFWLLLIPSSVALLTGIISCFQTKPHSRRRSTAYIGLLIGLVMVIFLVYELVSFVTGLYKYG